MANPTLQFTMSADGNLIQALNAAQTEVKRLDSQVKKSSSVVRAYGSEHTELSKRFKFFKGALQQAGYQIGDYAVQVANGTSKMQAFGQQGAQLAGIFGPMGAVIGAGIAIFSAIAVAAEKTAEAARKAKLGVDSFKDGIEKAASATSAAAEAISMAAAKNIDSAREKFSDFDGDLKGYLQTVKRLRTEQATTAASMAAQAFFEEQGAINKLRAEYQAFIKDQQDYRAGLKASQSDTSGLISEYQKEIAALEATASAQEAMGASAFNTRRQIAELKAEMDAVRTNSLEPFMSSLSLPEGVIQNILIYEKAIKSAFAAGNVDGAVVNLGKLRQIVVDLPKPLQEKMLPALLEMEGEARKLGAAISETGDEAGAAVEAARPLVKILSQASYYAGILAKNIAASPMGFQKMKDQTAIIQAEIDAINAGYGELGASVEAFRKQKEIELGLSEAANDAERAYISALINRETEAFRQREQASQQLSELQKQFVETGNSGGGAMNAIKEAMTAADAEAEALRERMKSIADTMKSAMTSAFMSIVDGTKSAKEAFKDMARSIIAKLYEVLVVQRMVGSFSYDKSGKAVGTGLVGAIMGAFSGARAMGGPVTGGKAYLVGEKGPEVVVPSRNATVIPNGASGGGGVSVTQNISFGAGVSRSEINAMLPKIVESTKAAVFDAQRRSVTGRGYA